MTHPQSGKKQRRLSVGSSAPPDVYKRQEQAPAETIESYVGVYVFRAYDDAFKAIFRKAESVSYTHLGQVQRLDKVVAGAAAGEQQRKLAAGHAVDDLKERAVAADGDDARHLLFRRLPRVCTRFGGAFGHKCAVREALAAQDVYKRQNKSSIPSRDKLTYKNGYYVNVTALFIDIVDSSKLTDGNKRPTLAKMYRAFLSECVAIMNSWEMCKEININGDCVWGVFETPKKSDVDDRCV